MIIYKTTNLINGKIYIGQHKCNKYARCNNGCKYLGSGIALCKAIKKYGKENFKREILEEGLFNKDEAWQIEEKWIQHFDARNKKIGYNIAKAEIAFMRGTKRSEETKRKLREVNIGKKHSEESKKKMSESHKNLSDETRKKIGLASSKRKHTPETKEKLRLLNIGKKRSKETREKIRKSKLGNTYSRGRKATEETKRKLSESHKGQISWMLGKKHTEASKEKIKLKRSLQIMKFTKDDIERMYNLWKSGKKAKYLMEVFKMSRSYAYLLIRKFKQR